METQSQISAETQSPEIHPRLSGIWMKQYTEILDRIEFAQLPDNLWRRLLELRLLLKYDGSNGVLPDSNTIAFRLRKPEEEIKAELRELILRGLVIVYGNNYQLPNFSEEQGTDSDANRKDRQRKKDRMSRPSHADVTNRDTDKNRIDKNRIEKNTLSMDASVRGGGVITQKSLRKVESEPSPEFLTFWQAYPRKSAKKQAWKAWRTANLPPIEKVMKVLARQKSSDEWQRDKGKYIPHPATWINQGRFDDEPINITTDTNRPGFKYAKAF